MKAVILAGGLGTRLRSIVSDRPKPMAEVDAKPFLEYQIEFLRRFEVRELVMCVGHLHQRIVDHFKNGHDWGVNITYSVESQPLGTAGALKNAEAYLNGAFLLLNGDSYFDTNLSNLLKFHLYKRSRSSNYLGTLLLTETDRPADFGSVNLDPARRIVSFAEKTQGNGASGWINAGVYLLESRLLREVPAGKKVSLERDVFPRIIENGSRLFGLPSKGFFVDIGTPQGYRRFRNYLEGNLHDYQK
jgi:D-glycero-alpha-D-manno-heptose 1-phosphate guanylyltransferase